MSQETNSKLLEEARQLIEYWEGTIHAEILRNDIASNDLENLHFHVDDARHEMLALEFNPEEDSLVGSNDIY